MKNYKYKLETGSKHIICPNCGKKTFKCYVNTNTGERVNSAKYGRCERISSCRYHLCPDNDDSEWQDYEPYKKVPLIKPKPDFISPELVYSTFINFNENPFYLWLCKLFGAVTALELQQKYNIGTAKNNGTIFWQKDKDGNFRTGKVFYYQNNGKRRKDKPSWYVHKNINKDFTLEQVFFGEHLTNLDTPVALCESEKTAICMSVFEPQYTWVASGGAMMLNVQRLASLGQLDFVSPDNGMFDLWATQTNNFKRDMDLRVETAFANGIVKEGADILDLILINKKLT